MSDFEFVFALYSLLLGLSMVELLGGLGLPLSYPAPFSDLRPIMSLDKKARGSSLRLVGLRAVGSVTALADPDEDVLARATNAPAGSVTLDLIRLRRTRSWKKKWKAETVMAVWTYPPPAT